MATVSLETIGKSVQLEGIVGPNHRIQPLPTAERSESGLIPHMIHEIERNEMRDKVLTFTEENQLSRISGRADGNRAPIPPAEVTVEVFIVADKPHHRYFNTTKDFIVYFCVTLNSVSDESFLRGSSKYTHDSQTLGAFRVYAKSKKSSFGTPDVVFFFTGNVANHDRINLLGMPLFTFRLGIAYLGGVCTDNYVGLGEDRPGFFNGMFTFSHEMGHLLGAQHDGSKTVPLVPGYMGSESCSWEEGYLMSYKDKGANHQRFSACSLRQMRLVISYRGQTCWVVLSTQEEQVDLYPGNVVKPLDVCRNAMPDKTGVYAEMATPKGNECKLKCSYDVRQGGYIYTYSRLTDAPDYTSCGEKRVCVRGLCEYDSKGRGNRTQKTETPRPTVTPKPTSRATTRSWWSNWSWYNRQNRRN
ncbi:hypothetical protein V5799_000144 [Amblyomma americanum]|uniref:Peptidase M12B domain-containing protein n=1 Tax=Amblyomma americanum TaxID=6943 RepID=A0AAQ4D3W1_AMBAM